MTALIVEHVTKRYGDLVAADDVSFEVAPGEVFVLLGPNGAGKTTTVEIAEGLRTPDAGAVRILGDAPTDANARERMGVMPQRGDLYAGIRTEEAVRLFASFYDDAEDPEAIIAKLDLDRVRQTTYRRLSGGEKRRLSFALAVIGRPAVLFLDEPTAEMDVEGRRTVWHIVDELRGRGSAIVLTTHELDEAERVASRVAFMRRGVLVATGSPQELQASVEPQITLTLARPVDEVELARRFDAEVTPVGTASYRLTGITTDPGSVAAITAWLAEHDVLVATMHVGARSLEEVYLELTR